MLRSLQLFRRVALADAIGPVAVAAVSVGLAYASAPLWALIAVGGAVPAAVGLVSLWLWRAGHVSIRAGSERPAPGELREFGRLAWQLLAASSADLVIYSLDRVILAAFRSTATVGLYEGPVRAHNSVRVITGTLGVTVLPAASAYRAANDEQRTRDLLVRGTRYVLALVLPIVAVLCAVAEPLLDAWLGPRFGAAATSMTILLSYWLINANTIVAGAMLVSAGETAWLARYAWLVALSNLGLSLALTPALGLKGVVLGTTIPYVLAFPWFMRKVTQTLPVSLAELGREAWLPGYVTAAVVALVVVGVRLVTDVHGLSAVVGLMAGGLALGYACWWWVWLRPGSVASASTRCVACSGPGDRRARRPQPRLPGAGGDGGHRDLRPRADPRARRRGPRSPAHRLREPGDGRVTGPVVRPDPVGDRAGGRTQPGGVGAGRAGCCCPAWRGAPGSSSCTAWPPPPPPAVASGASPRSTISTTARCPRPTSACSGSACGCSCRWRPGARSG